MRLLVVVGLAAFIALGCGKTSAGPGGDDAGVVAETGNACLPASAGPPRIDDVAARHTVKFVVANETGSDRWLSSAYFLSRGSTPVHLTRSVPCGCECTPTPLRPPQILRLRPGEKRELYWDGRVIVEVSYCMDCFGLPKHEAIGHLEPASGGDYEVAVGAGRSEAGGPDRNGAEDFTKVTFKLPESGALVVPVRITAAKSPTR